VQQRTGLPRDGALGAACATLTTLGERLGDTQADELAAHLPPSLAGALDDAQGCAPFDADEFVARIARRRGVPQATAAGEACAVMGTLAELLPETEMDYVRATLSEDYRPLLAADDGVQGGDGLPAPGPDRTSTSCGSSVSPQQSHTTRA
jgi:uncharacterized protein (DUF2267 family)